MGGVVSTGRDNDDLTDKLAKGNYIKSEAVERLFRAVDRAHYFLPDQKEQAYRDSAWRSGNIHMSAPCVYSEVLEALQLKKGLSFLNLGSGTGYLSTMVGFALGPYAVNHGIELHPDVVGYSRLRWEEFVKHSESWDEFDDPVTPVFVQGNCLLCPTVQRYDRIYCGAACPENRLNKLKLLLRPGGILVVPVGDRLVQYLLAEDGFSWSNENRMPVSFAGLITPSNAEDFPTESDQRMNESDEESDTFEPPQIGADTIQPEVREKVPHLPEISPQCLQHLCRIIIRRELRHSIIQQHPELLSDRRMFDRVAHNLAEQELKDAETSRGNGHRNRTDVDGRTRIVPVGNNLGVVVIGENDLSSDEEGRNSDNDDSNQQRNRDIAMSDTDSDIAEGNQETRPLRAQMPNLLRLLLETRRLHQLRNEAIENLIPNEPVESNPSQENDDSDHSSNANGRRRRRISSSTSSASMSTDSEIKKQKESTETEGNGDNKSSVEGTGSRMSRFFFERVKKLDLPLPLESFILYSRQHSSRLNTAQNVD